MTASSAQRPHPFRAAAPVMLLAAIGAAAGCRSIDPAPDQHRAEAAIAQRTAVETPWTGVDPGALWDGRGDLDADTAVRLALAGQPELRGAMARIAASRADLVQAGLLPNPVLNVGLGFPVSGPGGATGISVGLVQSLASLLLSEGRTRSAGFDLDAEVLSASELGLRTAARARALHARIVLAQRAAAVRREWVENGERALGLARRSVAAGEGSSLEVNRRDVRLLDMRAGLADAEAELGVLKRELLALIGRAEASADWRAADSDPAGSPTLPPGLSEESVVALAAAMRLDSAAAQARADAALARAGLARREVWSHAEAGIEYSRDEDKRGELGPSVALPIPIFDTGEAASARAGAQARQAVVEARIARDRAITEARAAFIRASASAESLRRYGEAMTGAADRNLELSRRAFDAGTLELTALLEAEERAIEARLRTLELRQAAVLGVIELERAVGGRLDPSLVPPAPTP